MIMTSYSTDETTIVSMRKGSQKAYERAMQIRTDYYNGEPNIHLDARVMQIYHQDGFDYWIDLGPVLKASEQLLAYIQKKGIVAPLAAKNETGKPVLAFVFAKRRLLSIDSQ